MGRASRPRARACVRIARAPRREHKACAAGRLVGLSVGFPAGTAIVRLWNDEQAWDHDRLDRLERRVFDAHIHVSLVLLPEECRALSPRRFPWQTLKLRAMAAAFRWSFERRLHRLAAHATA